MGSVQSLIYLEILFAAVVLRNKLVADLIEKDDTGASVVLEALV